MSFRQQPIGGPIRVVFTSPFGNDRITVVIKDGVVTLDSPVVTLLTGDVYKLVFTPSSTGVYDVIVDNVLVATVEVVTRGVFDFLKNIEDVSLGSWSWSKSTGLMTLFRQDGTELSSYVMVDNAESASQTLSL